VAKGALYLYLLSFQILDRLNFYVKKLMNKVDLPLFETVSPEFDLAEVK
jgi:hypothetical protein